MKGLKALTAICVLLFAVAFRLSIAQATIPDGNLWAVIVCGNNDLSQESDFLYETLTTYNFTDIYYLHVNTSKVGVDVLATKDNVRLAFNTTLRQLSGPNDIIFIYMMGHGGGLNMLTYEFMTSNTILDGRAEVSWDDEGKPAHSDEGNEIREDALFPAGSYWNCNDINKDGDWHDWVGVDECIKLDGKGREYYWDDEVKSDLLNLEYYRMVFVYVGCLNPFNITDDHCYSGGFIDDLSAPNRIIMTPSSETFPAIRKFENVYYPQNGTHDRIVYDMSFWGEQFIAALGVNKTQADKNNDQVVSMKEAWDFAKENDPMTVDWHLREPKFYVDLMETPWLDDNGNGLPTFIEQKDKLDNYDGLLSYETHLGFNPPIKSPNIDGDRDCDLRDVVLVARAYDSKPNDPFWNERYDLNNDGWINLVDVVIEVRNYEKYY